MIRPAINIQVYRHLCACMYTGAVTTSPASPHRLRTPRRAVRHWVSPALFDFWASRFSRTLTFERPLARVVAREAASIDAVTLRLRPNRHWRGLQPGQHVNVSAEIEGSLVTRSYSPRRCSADPRCIEITVKRIPGGKLSPHLCDRVQVGDVLDLGPAFGAMALASPLSAPVLMLAAGSGITPMLALLRALDRDGFGVPVTLLYWARTRAELCFADELRGLAARQPNFRLRLALTREAVRAGDEIAGRLDAALLAREVDAPSARDVFACGPAGFVAGARALLDGAARSFQAEAFTLPAPLGEDTEGEVWVTLAHSQRRIAVPRGQSLLSALEAQGLKPKSGCRMGICNTCACGKSAGSTRKLLDGTLEHEPVTALKLCISSAASDLVLEL
jgi:stearoyl-CoA 9-desaturase NADPH oxidoreductase